MKSKAVVIGFKGCILAVSFSLCSHITATAEVISLSVLEMVRGSKLIMLARCIDISEENYNLKYEFFPGTSITDNRYGTYEVLEVWKGKYNEKTFDLDYLATNKKYPPFGCVVYYPPGGKLSFRPLLDELVVLFVEGDGVVFRGPWGKVAVNDSTIELYREAVAGLIEFDNLGGEERVLKTVEYLEDENPHIRESMDGELQSVDKELYSLHIARLLRHEDSRIRRLALFTIIGSRDTAVVRYIIPLLGDSSSIVRSNAATALWRIPDSTIDKALINHWPDPDPGVRQSLIFALYQRRCHEAAPLYFQASNDSDAVVRSYAVTALGGLEGGEATDYIEMALNDENARVQSSALLALRYRTRPSHVAMIKRFLYLDDKHLFDSAMSLLNRLADSGYIDEKRDADVVQRLIYLTTRSEDSSVRSRALYALGRINVDELRELLPRALEDEDPVVRATAAEVVSKNGYKGFHHHLRKALGREKDTNTIFWIQKALEVPGRD